MLGDTIDRLAGLMSQVEPEGQGSGANLAEAPDILSRLAAIADRITDPYARARARLHLAALADIAEHESKAGDARTSVASGVPDDLLALYDRVRTQVGGRGAAMLRRGKCEGCNVSLSTVELNEIRAAAPDEVVRHEECRRILIRTAESGL